MSIDAPISFFRAAAATILYAAFWLGMIYLGEGRWEVLGALEVGLYFGGLYWFGMSLISSRGQINKLLVKAGMIRGADSE